MSWKAKLRSPESAPRRNALHVRLLALLLRLVLDGIVLPDALQEVLVAPRLPHVLHTHVEALAELAALHHLMLFAQRQSRI